jgi:hypothetical protein
MPAQKSAHDTPPGIGVEAQFISWQSQYFWQAGESVLEPPPAPALEPPPLPALMLLAPALLAPAFPVAAPPSPAELGAPLAPPPESLELQPSAFAHNEMEAMRKNDRM